MLLEPETISNFDLANDVINRRLAGAIYEAIAVFEFDRTDAITEFSSKEVVP